MIEEKSLNKKMKIHFTFCTSQSTSIYLFILVWRIEVKEERFNLDCVILRRMQIFIYTL